MAEIILLVDDDNDTLRLVGFMLQRHGYEVCVANSGQQSLEMVRVENPDLVLLDVMMPNMDSYEIARRLRADTAIQTKALLNDRANLWIKDSMFVMIVINLIRSGVHLSLNQVQEQLGRGIEVIFTPDARLAYQAASYHSPIILHQPDSLSAQQFNGLTERITR
jgi:CheY-like chemotaxis protein